MVCTYIISIFERSLHFWIHVMVIQSHEESIAYNAKGDKEVGKWVENDERQCLQIQHKWVN